MGRSVWQLASLLVGAALAYFTPEKGFPQHVDPPKLKASFNLQPTGRYLVRVEPVAQSTEFPRPYDVVEALRNDAILPKAKAAYELFRYPPLGTGDRFFPTEEYHIPPHRWYLVDMGTPRGAGATVAQAWDQAYVMFGQLSGDKYRNQHFSFFVEPDLLSSGVMAASGSCASSPTTQTCHGKEFKCSLLNSTNVALSLDAAPSCEWAPIVAKDDTTFSLNWPLERLGLLEAQRSVNWRSAESATGIAILDTGYFAGNPALPTRLNVQWARSFIDGIDGHEKPHQAIDPGRVGNCGHGTATMALLAAGPTKVCEGSQIGTVTLGGAPAANVLPVRIAESVIHLWTSSMAAGIAYASMPSVIHKDIMGSKFEKALVRRPSVISISMGGVASRSWADAINLAYELGVVVVAASGNNFGNFPTRHVVYPARFHRAIAAVGITWDSKPYEASPPEKFVMQGNFGPIRVMGNALSAYTPNTPWVGRRKTLNVLDIDGAGTSSATPQIAAAAAHLFEQCNPYLMKHFPEEKQSWKRAQFVRNALWSTALSSLNEERLVPEKFGRGRLNTIAALAVCNTDRTPDVTRAPIDSADWPFFRILFGLGEQKDPANLDPMFELEASQIEMSEAPPELQQRIAANEEEWERGGSSDQLNVEDLAKKLRDHILRSGSQHLQKRVGCPGRRC